MIKCFFLHRAHRLCNNAIWPIVVVVPMLCVYMLIGSLYDPRLLSGTSTLNGKQGIHGRIGDRIRHQI